jgi:hypothetical protein
MVGTYLARLLAGLALFCALFSGGDAFAQYGQSCPHANPHDPYCQGDPRWVTATQRPPIVQVPQRHLYGAVIPWSGGDLCAGTPTGPLACAMTGRVGGSLTGQIRLAQSDQIKVRNAANSADLNLISTDGANDVFVGDTGVPIVELLATSATAQLTSGTFAWTGASTVGWASATDTPSLIQLQQANGSNPHNMTIAPQAPGAGAASTATGTPGSLVVNVAAPVSTGTESLLEVTRANTLKFAAGPSSGTGLGNVGTIYLGSGITPSASNYALASDGSTVLVNALTELALSAGGAFTGGAVMADIGAAGVQLASRTQSFGGGTGVVGIANATGAPSSNPSGGGILYEGSGELSHRGSGGVITELAAPGSGTQNTQTGGFQKRVGFLRTTSTSTVTIYTVTNLAASHVATIEAVVNSIDTTSLASSASARIACSFVNSGGTVSQVGSTTTVYNHNYTSAPSCAISGTSVNVQFTPKTTDTTDSQADVYVSVN